MGAGKSTVGKRLAKKMGFRFLDMDDLIEKKENMPIHRIFSEKGEDYFRKAEQNILKETILLDHDLVVSTGGGAPCYRHNMDLLNAAGISIYLKASPQQLFLRLSGSGMVLRPLIHDKSPDELKKYISDKLKEREPFYLKSRLVIQADNIRITELEKQIRKLS